MKRAGLITTLTLALAGLAGAADFQVTPGATADLPDINLGNGVCDAAGGVCTLRAAVQEANQTAMADTIHVPAGIYALTRFGPDEEVASLGDLDLLESVDVLGAGPGVTIIDGNDSDRIFDLKPGISVTISGMTLRNGRVQSPANFLGGAILVNPSSLDLEDCAVENNRANAGGGLRISDGATASVLRCTFRGNQALEYGFTPAFGGAISNSGDLDLEESTLVSNSASVTGGALSSQNALAISIRNSTISANMALGINPGGIYSQNTETDLVNATVYGNSGTGFRFFTFSGAESLSIKNSIVAASGEFDCDIDEAAVLLDVTGEHNLDTDGTCMLDGAQGDFPHTDPQLGPLLLNGGSTPTHVPLQASPVIDSGNDDTCEVTDQRGANRPLDGDGVGAVDVCDIGAVEVLPCIGDADLDLVEAPMMAVDTYEACFTITARGAFQVPAGGDIAFRSRDAVVLGNGFAVLSGASFEVIRDPAAGSGIVLASD
jgi:hypothetical protein